MKEINAITRGLRTVFTEMGAMRTAVQGDSFYTEEAVQYTRTMEFYAYTMRMTGLAWNGYFLSAIGKILGLQIPEPEFDNEEGEFNLTQGHGYLMPSCEDFDATMQSCGGAEKTNVPVVVGKSKKGYTWTVPILIGTQANLADNMFSPVKLANLFGVSWSAISEEPYSTKGFKPEVVEQLVQLMGEDFFDIEVPYSKVVLPKNSIAEMVAATKIATINDVPKWHEADEYKFYSAGADVGELINGYGEWITEHFDGFLIQSAPLTRSAWNFMVSKELPDGKTDRVMITTLKDAKALEPQMLTQYVAEVLQIRKKTVSARINMPAAVAEYCVQRPANQIDISHVGRYCVARFTNEVLQFQYVEHYINRQISDIRQLNAATPSTTPVRPGVDPRSGLGMTPRGFPIYIPVDMDTIDEYEAKQSSIAKNDPNGYYYVWDALDIPGNMSLPTKPVSERPRPKIDIDANTILYVDWRNRVLSYTDQQGGLRIEEIGDYRPINMRSLKIYLEYPAFIALNRATTRQTRIAGLISYFLKHRLLKPLQSYVDADEIRNYLTVGDEDLPSWVVESYTDDFVRFLSRGDTYAAANTSLSLLNRRVKAVTVDREFPDSESWLEEAYLDTRKGNLVEGIRIHHITAKSPHIIGRIVYRALDEAYKYWKMKFGDFTRNRAVLSAIEEFAVIAITHKYANRYGEIVRTLATKHPSSLPDVPEDYVTPAIAGVQDDFKIQPHQLRVDYHLAGLPEDDSFILNVAAGGGKTISIWTDVARRVDKGLCKRPLVLCPGYLMKNYIEDGQYLFQGRYNVVCIDAKNVKAYKSKSGPGSALGVDGIRDMIMAAPINTLFVTSYDFISLGKPEYFTYGSTVLKQNPNLDMLIECGFDYIASDESHEMRNVGSGKHQAAAVLYAQIPVKGLATGTFLNTRPEDMANQLKLLNPAVFGSTDDFVEEHADSSSGGKILSLRPAAKEEIVSKLKSNSRYIQVKRKEWAALLPKRKDQWHILTLPEDSIYRKMYDTVLDQVMAIINEILKKNQALAKKIKEDAEDEEADSNWALDDLLKPFLQRLEQLLISPQTDPDFQELVGNLEVPTSPKILKAIQICEGHIYGKTRADMERFNSEHAGSGIEYDLEAGDVEAQPGKILIFCGYARCVQQIYESMPEDLKAMTVYYTSGAKDKDIQTFKNNKAKRILVGIGTSLATGHNFQMATRIIRMEGIWSPGELEQSESRINRPDIKNKGAQRTQIFYDWIAVNGTIDISKLSRLTSRILMMTMIEELDNPAYANIKQLPLVSMNLDAIRDYATVALPGTEAYRVLGDKNLYNYLVELHGVREIQKVEYAEYADSPKGKLTAQLVEQKPPIKGSAVLEGAPPIPGMSIPNMTDLGISNYSDYVDRASGGDPNALQEYNSAGLRVWTAEGDGIIQSMSDAKVTVLIKGVKYSFFKLCVFVYPDECDRSKLLASIGLKKVVDISGRDLTAKELRPTTGKNPKNVPAPIPEMVEEIPQKKTTVKRPVPHVVEEEVEANGEVYLYAQVYNGAISIAADLGDADIMESKGFFQEVGFHYVPANFYAAIPNYKAFTAILNKLDESFTIPPKQMGLLRKYEELFSEGKTRTLQADASNADILDFYRAKRKTIPSGTLMPYVCVEGTDLYLMLDAEKQVSAVSAKRIRVPGVKWEDCPASLRFICATKAEAVAAIKAIKSEFTIANVEDLKAELKAIKIRR